MRTPKVAGNASKLREALEELMEWLEKFLDGYMPSYPFQPSLIGTRSKTVLALAAPPRNCDVGTAMEQASRYRIFCKNHAYHCNTCPFGEKKQDCEFIWAQLPYAEAAQEGGDK